MGYTLSKKAEEDIVRLYLEGAEMFGAQQAERYHAGLERVFRFLSDHPEAAREREEIDPPVRVHRYGSHIVVYVVQEAANVLIVRVRHGREDWLIGD